jgi:hypothetical protein
LLCADWQTECFIALQSFELEAHMRRTPWILGILLGSVAIAAGQTPNEGPKGMGPGTMVHGACPTPLKGADVALADIPNGIVVTFITKPGNVAELQRSVEWLANMQKAMAGGLELRERLLPGDVTYEPLPQGARLTFKSREADKTEEFRTQVRARVDQMTKDNCAMMENMMRAMTRMEPHRAGAMGHHALLPETK